MTRQDSRTFPRVLPPESHTSNFILLPIGPRGNAALNVVFAFHQLLLRFQGAYNDISVPFSRPKSLCIQMSSFHTFYLHGSRNRSLSEINNCKSIKFRTLCTHVWHARAGCSRNISVDFTRVLKSYLCSHRQLRQNVHFSMWVEEFNHKSAEHAGRPWEKRRAGFTQRLLNLHTNAI